MVGMAERLVLTDAEDGPEEGPHPMSAPTNWRHRGGCFTDLGNSVEKETLEMAENKTIMRRLFKWASLPLVLLAAGLAWYFTDPGFRTSGQRLASTESRQSKDFEQRVRTYILENPEIIVKALQRYESRRRAAEVGEIAAIVKARYLEIARDPSSPVGGNPDGDVTLVEFFDYNCPYCRRVAPAMDSAAKADPNLRIVYKEMPILGQGSVFAAKAALAAERQGRYEVFHKAMMKEKGGLAPKKILEIAADVGLNLERLKKDMEDPVIEAAIAKNLALAQDLRITGTPGFVVGQQIVRGATDLATLQKLIKDARTSQ